MYCCDDASEEGLGRVIWCGESVGRGEVQAHGPRSGSCRAAALGVGDDLTSLPPWWGACAGVIRLLRKAPDKHGHPEHILSREERKAPVIGGQPWPTP